MSVLSGEDEQEDEKDLPLVLPSVLMMGLANVSFTSKMSTLNSLTGRKQLAKKS